MVSHVHSFEECTGLWNPLVPLRASGGGVEQGTPIRQCSGPRLPQEGTTISTDQGRTIEDDRSRSRGKDALSPSPSLHNKLQASCVLNGFIVDEPYPTVYNKDDNTGITINGYEDTRDPLFWVTLTPSVSKLVDSPTGIIHSQDPR
jgi:hypothetical protein